MSSDTKVMLTDDEIRILAALQTTKSIDDIAKALGLKLEAARELAESATKKQEKLMESVLAEAKIKAKLQERDVSYKFFKRLQGLMDIPQKGSMKVGSQILELLSSGIYSSPENAFKELISNAFDADARDVKISVARDFNSILVHDTGEGMDYKDFDDNFTVISRSSKREEGELSKVLHRPLIGKIGIGFIAVAEICDKIVVKSAKRGSESWFEATIDFSQFNRNAAKKLDFYDVSNFVLVNHKKDDPDEHYTDIELKDLKPGFKDMLTDKGRDDTPPYRFSGVKTFKDIMDQLDQLGIRNVYKEVAGYWRFVINLALILPVPYLKGGPIDVGNSHGRFFNELSARLKSYDFNITFDGLYLEKPIRLPLIREEIKREGIDFNIFPFDTELPVEGDSAIRVQGYLYNQKSNIGVEDLLRGVIVRVKNTAIGGPDAEFMGYHYPEKMHLAWTFGEIYCDALESAMNIDRNTFKFADPRYQAVSAYLHNLLHTEVIPNARKRYSARKKDERLSEQARVAKIRGRVVANALGENYALNYVNLPKMPPVFIKNHLFNVNMSHHIYFLRSRKERRLVQDMLIAVRLALQKPTKNKQEFWAYVTRYLADLTED